MQQRLWVMMWYRPRLELDESRNEREIMDELTREHATRSSQDSSTIIDQFSGQICLPKIALPLRESNQSALFSSSLSSSIEWVPPVQWIHSSLILRVNHRYRFPFSFHLTSSSLLMFVRSSIAIKRFRTAIMYSTHTTIMALHSGMIVPNRGYKGRKVSEMGSLNVVCHRIPCKSPLVAGWLHNFSKTTNSVMIRRGTPLSLLMNNWMRSKERSYGLIRSWVVRFTAV